MAWTIPPTHSTGDVLAAGDWNDVVGDLTILADSFGLFGNFGAISGAAPVGTAGILLQAGIVGATASAANFSFSFPRTFPNGLLALFMQPVAPGDVDLITVLTGSSSVSTGAGQYWRSGSAVTGSIEFICIALGF